MVYKNNFIKGGKCSYLNEKMLVQVIYLFIYLFKTKYFIRLMRKLTS